MTVHVCTDYNFTLFSSDVYKFAFRLLCWFWFASVCVVKDDNQTTTMENSNVSENCEVLTIDHNYCLILL